MNLIENVERNAAKRKNKKKPKIVDSTKWKVVNNLPIGKVIIGN